MKYEKIKDTKVMTSLILYNQFYLNIEYLKFTCIIYLLHNELKYDIFGFYQDY